FVPLGLLYDHLDAIDQLAIGHHGRHHGVIAPIALLDMVPRFIDAPDLRATLVMRIGPIQAEHLTPAPTMLAGNHRTMARHESLSVPAGFKYCRVHRPARRGVLALPDLGVVEPLQGFVRTQQ